MYNINNGFLFRIKNIHMKPLTYSWTNHKNQYANDYFINTPSESPLKAKEYIRNVYFTIDKTTNNVSSSLNKTIHYNVFEVKDIEMTNVISTELQIPNLNENNKLIKVIFDKCIEEMNEYFIINLDMIDVKNETLSFDYDTIYIPDKEPCIKNYDLCENPFYIFSEENEIDIIIGDHIIDEYLGFDLIYNNSNSPYNPSSYFMYEKQTSEKFDNKDYELKAFSIQEIVYKEDHEIICNEVYPIS
jgi:hypothetical protein